MTNGAKRFEAAATDQGFRNAECNQIFANFSKFIDPYQIGTFILRIVSVILFDYSRILHSLNCFHPSTEMSDEYLNGFQAAATDPDSEV